LFQSRNSREQGLTLFELAIYGAVLIVMGGQLAHLVRVSVKTAHESDSVNKVTERNRVALYRIAKDVRGCVATSVTITDSGATLAFTEASGYDEETETVTTGATVTYRFEIASTETNNEVDDDGNGLIDEGRLVRVDGGTSESVVVCERLDLAKCGFTQSGTGVTINVSTQGFLRDSAAVMSIDRDLTVYPRN